MQNDKHTIGRTVKYHWSNYLGVGDYCVLNTPYDCVTDRDLVLLPFELEAGKIPEADIIRWDCDEGGNRTPRVIDLQDETQFHGFISVCFNAAGLKCSVEDGRLSFDFSALRRILGATLK